MNFVGAIQETAWPLIAVGAFLLVGYAAHVIGRRAHVPRVTLLLLIGVVAGPNALGLVPRSAAEWFPIVSEVALSIIGFMLGERFIGRRMKSAGKIILAVSIAETLGAAIAVFVVLALLGVPIELALLLAGIAPASAPAATVDVVRENGAAGPLTDVVLGVVAIDDVYGIALFSLLLVMAQAISGEGVAVAALASAGWEIVGGIGVGVLLGVPMAWVSGRARPGELTLIETLGFVLLCGGIAVALDVSYLLAAIALGATVANRAKHHERPFHAIEGIEQPFLIVFFLFAGFEFDLMESRSFGLAGLAYVVARSVGKLLGCAVGARAVDAPEVIRKYVGWCLLPQAGVALGLGLLAAQRFPEYGSSLLSLLVGTTFLFEVLGPIATRISLRRSGEAGRADPSEDGEAGAGLE